MEVILESYRLVFVWTYTLQNSKVILTNKNGYLSCTLTLNRGMKNVQDV